MRIQLCYYKDYIERPKEPFSQINAVDYDLHAGTRTIYQDSAVGFFDKNDYLTYNRVNFGPSGSSKKIKVRYARGSSGGKIEIRLGGPQGQLIGEFVTVNTGGWNKFSTKTIDINVQNVSGYQDLTFVGKEVDGLMNLSWFKLAP